MRFFLRGLAGIVSLLIGIGVVYAAWRIVAAKPAESSAHHASTGAKVAKPVKEAQLATIELTAEAEHRLGVRTAKVEQKPVRRQRIYGGEIMVPAGRTILVAAPFGGLLRAPSGGVPAAGQAVKKGQPIFLLLPLLTPEGRTTLAAARVDAEGQVKNASTQVDATNIAWERAKRLLREEAGSKRSVDETQAQHELAQKTFEAAEARLRLLAQAVGDAETGAAAPIIIESPEDGLLRNVNAMPEQTVPGGAPLLEVIDLHLVWVRVPIYVGDQDTISTMADAVIGNLTSKPGEFTMTAKPVDAPPSANALASTIDLYYSLPNPAGRLTPGQRVGVNISLRGEEKSLTLPWSAVVHDIYGGTWVYEQTKPSTYERRRVTVRDVVANDAVLATGPAVGTVVVAEGAQELFGAETGFSK